MPPEIESPESSKSATSTENSSQPLLNGSGEIPPLETPAAPKRSHKKKATGPKFKSKPKSSGARPSLSGSDAGRGPNPPGETRSTPGSSKFLGKGKGTLDAKDKKAIAASIAKGLQVGTAMGANLVVKDAMERDNSLFVANEDEATSIAKPIVSILDRRGIGAGAGDSDTADLIEILMGCVSYIRRNVALRREIKAYKAANGGTQTQGPGAEETIVRSTESPAGASGESTSAPATKTVNSPSVGATVLEGLMPLGLG
jgi:hypothetical protein